MAASNFDPKNRVITVSPDTLYEVAGKFRTAGEQTDKIIDGLDKSLKELEETWKGIDQQTFFKYFEEWRGNISGVSQLLQLAARELDSMAEKYYSADSDLTAQKKEN